MMLIVGRGAAAARRSMVFDMIGDGPMLEALKAQAGGVRHRRGDPLPRLARPCEVEQGRGSPAARTTLDPRILAAGVVLEAMALGLAPVIVDLRRPGRARDPGTV